MALALHADYGSNLQHYAEWQAYFQPPTLVTWGRYDFIFTVDGATAYRRDIPNAEIHILDTGHFALETSAEEIANAINRFLPQPAQKQPTFGLTTNKEREECVPANATLLAQPETMFQLSS